MSSPSHYSDAMIMSFQEASPEDVKKLRKRNWELDSKENVPPSKSRKKKTIFPYGNYPSYYRYRCEQGQDDPRFFILDKEWFTSKQCLDIGCNVGKLTFQIARKLHPYMIEGVDIDSKLISVADTILQKNVHQREKNGEKRPDYPISFLLQYGYPPGQYPFNISFRTSNILEMEIPEDSYDTVLCLSTTKWIHLNWGDRGIQDLFTKVEKSLKKGGLFVFEPQEFSTYKKKAKLTPIHKSNYNNIQLKPEQFVDYLTEKLGFNLLNSFSQQHVHKGFERPIYLLQKK